MSRLMKFCHMLIVKIYPNTKRHRGVKKPNPVPLCLRGENSFGKKVMKIDQN